MRITFCRAPSRSWLAIGCALVAFSVVKASYAAEAISARAGETFRPFLERTFALSDLSFASPLTFTGVEMGQQIFFPIPRDVPVHDATIELEGNFLRSDIGHAAFVAGVNDIPAFALEPKETDGTFRRSIPISDADLTNPFVKLDLRFSTMTTGDRCSDPRSIANVVTVSPRSLLRYRVDAENVTDARSAWGMLPPAPRILIPAGAVNETYYAAALKVALAMSNANRRPRIVSTPVSGDSVDTEGLAIPQNLAAIPAFQIFADASGRAEITTAAERGAYHLLLAINGRGVGEVAIGAAWLASQINADLEALQAQAERAGANAAQALANWIAALPTVDRGAANDNLALTTVMGQPVITLTNDASRAASLLATQWARLANAEGLDVTFAGSEPVDTNSILLTEFGGNFQAQSIIEYGEWVSAFDAAQLPAGRWPSVFELEMRVAPDASDAAPLVTVTLNDVLLRAEKINPNNDVVRVRADVPPYLLASRNTLRVSLQRGPSSADCRTLSRGYVAQILPTSRVMLSNEGVDNQFFGLKSKLANGALIVVPASYLATPAESLPYVYQFLRELKVSSSSIRLRAVEDVETYRPESTFVSFGVSLPGRRKNIMASNGTLHLTDETGLPVAHVERIRPAAMVQIVTLETVAGLSVTSTTGQPIPDIQVDDLGEGDVAIYDTSGRIGELGAGDFKRNEIRRALLQPSAIFHRYSVWIMTGVGVLIAMVLMHAARTFVIARRRRQAAAKAENAG